MESPSEKAPPDDSNPLGLSDAELNSLDEQIDLPPSDAGYLAIYRYSTTSDLVIMFFSAVMASVAGASLPLMTIVFGSLAGEFSDFTTGGGNADAFVKDAARLVLYFVYIGIACFGSTALTVLGFSFTGERISKAVRIAYLEAILRQNVGFIDVTAAGEVSTRITGDMNLVQDGVSQKVGLTIAGLSGFVAALAIAFARCWRLALVLLCQPVAFVLFMALIGGSLKKAQVGSIAGYSTTASFAEEIISSMRNVAAYGSQPRFLKKYNASLAEPSRLDFRAKMLLGLFVGSMMWLQLSGFALSFWQGARFMRAGVATVAEILTATFAMSIAAFQLGSVTPFLEAFAAAGAAANRILATVERRPPIGSTPGTTIQYPRGEIEFRDVKLIYPSRRNHLVLENFNLRIPAGKITAIVGPSGSGKSSIVSLLQRFYSPVAGQILLDGQDIESLSLPWLRAQMSMVGQEPFLFDNTVFDNIAYGLVGTNLEGVDEETRRNLVEDAAKTANAHDFISQLPRGYQTRVGERGGALSGGQRQRIAIARCVVSQPHILLLDEYTAAVDTRSEAAIQSSMAGAAEGRTALIIAHRLATIKNADKIVVLEHGRITEEGTHEELLSREGSTYAALVRAQELREEPAKQTSDTADSDVGENQVDNSLQLRKTKSGKASEAQTGTDEATASRWELAKFVWNLNGPEQYLLILGVIGSFFSGIAYPVMAIFFGYSAMSLTSPELARGHDVNFWSGMLLMLAFFIFIAYLAQYIPLAAASSQLGARARSVAFAAILRQDLAFFARAENASGTLAAFLSVQAQQLNGLSGATLGTVLNSVFTVVAAIAVSLSFGWKLGLVGTAVMPLLMTVGYARFEIVKELERRNLRSTAAAGVASEAVGAIRTVAALRLEAAVLGRYAARLSAELGSHVARNALSSVLYAAAQSCTFFAQALVFWYGGVKLIGTGEYNFANFLICFAAVIWGAQAAGSIFSHAPDVAGGTEAALRLKQLVDSVPQIDIESDAGEPVAALEGNVELRDIGFAYPSVPDHPVLRGINLAAGAGRFVALVGASGSGKSSVLNLLERLYDVGSGAVVVDGRDIRGYRLRDYRRQLALVEQDAILYGGTVRDNVIGDDENVGDAEIEKACRDANIWDFVLSLPEGLNTAVGSRGSRVSGGQKQRLAIARALLKNPKVLLLDEATSALDSTSERIVQRALDGAAAGRTTIAVAHRLSSIAHADAIFVFEEGRVVESGSHAALMARRGKYWEYVGLQGLGRKVTES